MTRRALTWLAFVIAAMHLGGAVYLVFMTLFLVSSWGNDGLHLTTAGAVAALGAVLTLASAGLAFVRTRRSWLFVRIVAAAWLAFGLLLASEDRGSWKPIGDGVPLLVGLSVFLTRGTKISATHGRHDSNGKGPRSDT